MDLRWTKPFDPLAIFGFKMPDDWASVALGFVGIA